MQNLYDEVGFLDTRCYEKFSLNEDILMEHAAQGMADYIFKKFNLGSHIIIVCGSSNNGADGLALSRLLHKSFKVEIFLTKPAKSEMAKLQYKRSKNLGIQECSHINHCDVIVDAFIGTGFKGEFSLDDAKIMQSINSNPAFKIACDIPSGLQKNGNYVKDSFIADISLTMGALKKSMYLDGAKDLVGEIKVINLGIHRDMYELESPWKLLDMGDLKLPFRSQKDSHKGSFGHLCIAFGEKRGASLLSAKAALRFGSGLVTLVGSDIKNIDNSIMSSSELPPNTTALALGMGLGYAFNDAMLKKFLHNDLPLVIDADIFHMSAVKDILLRKNVVLTPHPKEFVSLLQKTSIITIDISELQKNRFKYTQMFCKKFPNATLLLKGANVIIGQNEKFYINPHGTSALAKGGSGDVLSGLIASLLSQGYGVLDATINASLAHTKLAKDYKGADFSLTPEDLIAGIGNL